MRNDSMSNGFFRTRKAKLVAGMTILLMMFHHLFELS